MRIFAALFLALTPISVSADDAATVLDAILETHVLTGYSELVESSQALRTIAQDTCDPQAPDLRAAYHDAFDAWIAVSHLRFGPAATDDRIFALAFWPDSRGATPRSLAELIANEDPIIETAEGFSEVSVAARGFYALEFLLYDEATMLLADSPYGCALIQRVSADIHAISTAIEADWAGIEAPAMRAAESERYESAEDALLVFYAALSEGLQFTAEARLGRPMGTFERPRPRRAETWRSGRSLRNVQLSIASLRELAGLLGLIDGADREAIDAAFSSADARARSLDDPVFAGVSDPQGRFAVEVLQQRVTDALAVSQAELAPALGATLTFNSLDGD